MSSNIEQLELVPDEQETQQITIKFETSEHSINAVFMANSLLAFHNVISGIATNDNMPKATVEVSSVRSGCIEIGALILVYKTLGTICSYVTTLWDQIQSLYSLYQFLRGFPPKKTENKGKEVIVENNFGQICSFNHCVVNQYFNSPNAILGASPELLQNQELKGIAITDVNGKTLLEIPREQFKSLVPYNKFNKQQSENVEEIEQTLTIATINLRDPRRAWKFIDNNGNSFSAKIVDDSFIQKVSARIIAFRQGDMIQCILKIIKKYDASVGVYVINKRIILHIIQYTSRAATAEVPLL